jgi:hypothetical protein
VISAASPTADVNSIDYLAGRGLNIDTLAQHGVNAHSLGAMLLRAPA